MPDDLGHLNGIAGFSKALHDAGFLGELAQDYATRVIYATDNSVYELPPAAVVFPAEPNDLNRIASAASATGVAITARGGGTGTNGQSLTDAVVVDCSRYLTKIEEINATEGYAIVQPGVILDQLNKAAAAHDLFFAPMVSTASRATLGGMAATDASGKGSRVYGRTSDHVLDLTVVLANGQDMQATAPGDLGREIFDMLRPEAAEIARVFPKMNRGLTGYNLLETLDQSSLIKLLCGSEGTLALTKRLKLRLLPRPKARAIAVYAYSDMAAAFEDVPRLVAADPTAIEFIDDRILGLAQDDPIWQSLGPVLATPEGLTVRGLNFVEISAGSVGELQVRLDALDSLADGPDALLSGRVVTDDRIISDLLQLRSKCVGLLGRMDPTRQGTPFVEDAAVPAERLPAFVEGFRAILDGHGLAYGMFGHADVGCVHVRPALDMRQSEDAAKIRLVSDQVHALAKAHGGLIWGEHGKGFRGEYGRDVFGTRLYALMCRIKERFDPLGLLNPGKIAGVTPDLALTRIDEAPFRGPLDAAITPALSKTYDKSIRCNGNGQCMGKAADDAMCPSYKATGDRSRAPKGRAALLREWARLQSGRSDQTRRDTLETALFASLSDCLGCKACASQCPVKVNIPQMRSAFYADYYARKRRPAMHYLLRNLETLGPVLRRFPRVAGAVLKLTAPVTRRVGLVDLPAPQPPSAQPDTAARKGQIVLLADSFLATFDGTVLDAAVEVLRHLEQDVILSPSIKTAKPLHVIGELDAFAKVSKSALSQLGAFTDQGAELVAIEPAYLSMFAHEYAGLGVPVPKVRTLEQILLDLLPHAETPVAGVVHRLLSHCSEASADPEAAQRWREIFARVGLRLDPVATGCCGMAGTFGHERDKQELSRRIYDLSWKDPVETAPGPVLATGFSCRCQIARFSGQGPLHPIIVLRQALLD